MGSSSHASEGQVNDIPNNSAINDDPNETSPEKLIDNLDKDIQRSVHYKEVFTTAFLFSVYSGNPSEV